MGFTELTAFYVSYANLLTINVIGKAQIVFEDHQALVRDLTDSQKVVRQDSLLCALAPALPQFVHPEPFVVLKAQRLSRVRGYRGFRSTN